MTFQATLKQPKINQNINRTTGRQVFLLILLLRLHSVYKNVDETQLSKHFPCALAKFSHCLLTNYHGFPNLHDFLASVEHKEI